MTLTAVALAAPAGGYCTLSLQHLGQGRDTAEFRNRVDATVSLLAHGDSGLDFGLREADAAKREDVGEGVVVAIDVQDVGAVLLCAGTDQEIGQGNAVLPAVSEIALCRLGARQRCVVDA
ncbi:MAG: hypothetical protein QOJ85_4388, partial [Solirubrobacteraceae bacterium]|nr:hypothetical protein [Solirubrobacteraceae bacterium]